MDTTTDNKWPIRKQSAYTFQEALAKISRLESEKAELNLELFKWKNKIHLMQLAIDHLEQQKTCSKAMMGKRGKKRKKRCQN